MINENPEWGNMPFIEESPDQVFNYGFSDVNFASGGKRANSIICIQDINGLSIGYTTFLAAYSGYFGDITYWTDQAYRTITLDSPATGDFLTWLEANAVKQ